MILRETYRAPTGNSKSRELLHNGNAVDHRMMPQGRPTKLSYVWWKWAYDNPIYDRFWDVNFWEPTAENERRQWQVDDDNYENAKWKVDESKVTTVNPCEMCRQHNYEQWRAAFEPPNPNRVMYWEGCRFMCVGIPTRDRKAPVYLVRQPDGKTYHHIRVENLSLIHI